ncbi:MAG: helix-turn-helix domain-containing protein [Desulfurococcaceae archaeon]
MSIFYVEIKKPSRSFFGRLSKVSSSNISLEVIKLAGSDNYVVFAYSFNSDVGNYIEKLKPSLRSPESHIKRIRWWSEGKLTYIVAYKTMCDFLRLAETSGVNVLTPYVFERGFRKYVVLGTRDNLRRYFESIKNFYGRNNVSYSPIDTADYLSMILVRRSLLSIITDKLTPSELNVLRYAYNAGYFEHPRRINLDGLGRHLGLSKVTVDIHVRKVIKKVLEEVFRFVS